MATPHIQDEANDIRLEQNRVERIKKYISDNLKDNLGAAIVAQRFELSISSLQHIFKKHEQQTYQYYLEDERMRKAFDLMAKEGKRVKEVMEATGYRNRATFNNAFKKRFKHSPRYFGK